MSDKYQVESDSWVFGEIKQTIIGLYVVFKEKLAQYMLAHNGLYKDKLVAKAELVSAAYGFYGGIMKGFDQYLEKSKDIKIKPIQFKELLFSEISEIKDEDLREMCFELEKYHCYYGHGNLSIDKKVYKDIVDQLADENEI